MYPTIIGRVAVDKNIDGVIPLYIVTKERYNGTMDTCIITHNTLDKCTYGYSTPGIPIGYIFKQKPDGEYSDQYIPLYISYNRAIDDVCASTTPSCGDGYDVDIFLLGYMLKP